ncbi:hypothetical protein CMUS01_08224 [Colletotrichum musicola]|uniref:Uncharacterized protein n=1 Tax=Colletotrichum musicola TaxID=2175873 RepID=A0A8H6KD69_9PEZI|nr:hypothetical protein CMUS01_08224 [Colletotrichum musicola]
MALSRPSPQRAILRSNESRTLPAGRDLILLNAHLSSRGTSPDMNGARDHSTESELPWSTATLDTISDGDDPSPEPGRS